MKNVALFEEALEIMEVWHPSREEDVLWWRKKVKIVLNVQFLWLPMSHLVIRHLLSRAFLAHSAEQ
jgi:hypothetical protein